jgi:biotin/methionine sulfoxide reductase
MPELQARWLAPRPGSDVALILGLAHTLLVEGLHDKDFLARCTSGFDRFADYLMGRDEGVPRTAEWAAALCELPAAQIRELAREMARSRTMLMMSWSLQRAEFGEQPYWALVALASMLGQVGLPGGGFGFGYGCVNGVGRPLVPINWPAMPQGKNPVTQSIPVARIADMLLKINNIINILRRSPCSLVFVAIFSFIARDALHSLSRSSPLSPFHIRSASSHASPTARGPHSFIS